MTAEQTYPLRQKVLRPHQSIAEVAFPGDDDPDTGHFAAFLGRGLGPDASSGDRSGGPVGVVTVLHQSPGSPLGPHPDGWWRLRGMATAEDHRGSGVGSALVEAALAHAAAYDATVLWCYARLPAVGFYRKHGFVATGDPWEEPAIGPHVAMWRSVPQP